MKKLLILLSLIFVLFGCNPSDDVPDNTEQMTYKDMLEAETFHSNCPSEILSKKINLLEINDDATNKFTMLEENDCSINIEITKIADTTFDIYFDFVGSATSTSYKTYSLSPCFKYSESSNVVSEGAVDILIQYELNGKMNECYISCSRFDRNNEPNVQYQIELPEEFMNSKDNTIVIMLDTYFFNEGKNK